MAKDIVKCLSEPGILINNLLENNVPIRLHQTSLKCRRIHPAKHNSSI